MTFIWPLDDHIVTRGFHYLASLYVGGQHAAIDLIRRTGLTRAAPIMAVADGVVAGVGWDMYSGFFVAVDHAGGFRSFYRHLYGQTPAIVGQRVSQGQVVGNVGNTGWSQGDHLHFDLWCRERMDPTAFYKNGWWAHDPALYLGLEDDMDDARVRQLIAEAGHVTGEELLDMIRHDHPQFRDNVNALIRGAHIDRDKEVAGLKAALGLLWKAVEDIGKTPPGSGTHSHEATVTLT